MKYIVFGLLAAACMLATVASIGLAKHFNAVIALVVK